MCTSLHFDHSDELTLTVVCMELNEIRLLIPNAKQITIFFSLVYKSYIALYLLVST